MKLPVKLSAGIVLALLALAAAVPNRASAFFISGWIVVFGGIHVVLLHRRYVGRPLHSRGFWCTVVAFSLLGWFVFYWSAVVHQPEVIGGPYPEPPPEPKTILEQPWEIPSFYLILIKDVAAGGYNAVICAAIIALSLLFPSLAIRAALQLRSAKTRAKPVNSKAAGTSGQPT